MHGWETRMLLKYYLERGVSQAAMRSSRLPAVKTLAQFDFTFQPSIKREQIESLHELGFLDRAENVILLGPPGVGKTHLAISLAIAAAEAGRRVYYGTLAGLIDSLMDARAAGALSRRLRVLTHPALLVVDEIGDLPVSQDGAVLFFQLLNARHERASTVLTRTRASRNGDTCSATRSWRRRSSTGCCTIATSSTSGATATGCGSISTGCGQRRTNGVRESRRDRRPRSVAARVGQDSGRAAPCVQPNTPGGHQRENVRSARQLSPRRVQFSVAKSVQFSVAIDTVGSRLGHYDVTALIGEGGMGQVYQATDTTLDRDVAIKVLPDAFASDPERLARFEREAKVLASLNQPNIGAIYGLERSGDTRALVLELVEGPTLADRIKQGPIPLD